MNWGRNMTLNTKTNQKQLPHYGFSDKWDSDSRFTFKKIFIKSSIASVQFSIETSMEPSNCFYGEI